MDDSKYGARVWERQRIASEDDVVKLVLPAVGHRGRRTGRTIRSPDKVACGSPLDRTEEKGAAAGVP